LNEILYEKNEKTCIEADNFNRHLNVDGIPPG